VSTQEAFGRICRRVCEAQGWELWPSGVRIALPAGRHQLVSIEFLEHEREELVRLVTTIGDAKRLDAVRLVAALELNAALPHGALAIRDGELVMVDTLMLRDAGPAEIEAALAYLATTADRWERALYGKDEH
jgi:hypothetical protein